MRQLARLLLVISSLIWLTGLLPAESRACSMQNDRCCLAEPVCAMDCCRVPGNLYGDAVVPVAATLQQLPTHTGLEAWGAPELLALKAPVLELDAASGCTSEHGPTPPEKIYLRKRALLI